MRIVLALALLFCATPAWACDGAPRPDPFDPYAGLAYDDSKHRAWYKRFWTGRCEGLGFFDFCVSDEGGWPKLTADTLARAPAADRPALRGEMRGLGLLIGHEWARANDVRSVDTGDLQRWNEDLEEASDPAAAVAGICAEAKAKLGQ